MLNVPVPARPTCSRLGDSFVAATCSHGHTHAVPMRCRDYEDCQPCRNAYFGNIRKQIRQGIESRPTARYSFLTLTLCRHTRYTEGSTHCPQCLQPADTLTKPTATSILLALRKLRRAYNSSRTWQGSLRYFRVLEVHQNGVPHLHLVYDSDSAPDVPQIPRPLDGESLAAYYQRQTPKAQAFIDFCRSHGFGTITCNEYARSGGSGIASYLSKYLSKMGKAAFQALRSPSGRRVRLYEGSRDWNPRTSRPSHQHAGQFVSNSTRSLPSEPCPSCDEEERQLIPALRDKALDDRRKRWLSSLPAHHVPVVLNFWRDYTRSYSNLHAKLTTQRRQFDEIHTLLYPCPNSLASLPERQATIESLEAQLENLIERKIRFFNRVRVAAPKSLLTHKVKTCGDHYSKH